MSSLNKVQLIGNTGNDPEVRTLESGKKVASFSLATTEHWKDKAGEKHSDTEWHNIVLWSPLAEIVEKYVKKGTKIYIEGKNKTRNWEDKEGNKKYVTEVVGRDLILLGEKPSSQSAPEPTVEDAGEIDENSLPL